MGGLRYANVCNALAEVGLVLILLLAVLSPSSISARHSFILFAFLWLLVLDALRVPPPVVAWSLPVIFAVGAVGFTTRFLVSFPLTASPDLILGKFILSLLDPLPIVWAVILTVNAFYIPYRRYASAHGTSRPALEGVLILFVSLVIYQLSLSWRLSVNRSDTTFSLPYANALLFFAVVSRCVGAIPTSRTAFTALRLVRSQLAAFTLLAAHLAALGLLLSPLHGLAADYPLGLAGSLLGLVLFAGLVNTQLASARSRRRFKVALALILAAVVVSIWSGAEMLPEIRPGFVLVN